jgi:PAS domain S-box-containing protein
MNRDQGSVGQDGGVQTFQLTLAGCSANAIDVVNDALSGSDCHIQHVEDLSSLARKSPAGEDGLHSMILAFLPGGLDSREIDVHVEILACLAREGKVVAISANKDDAALSVALRAGIPLIPEESLNAGVVRRLVAELGSMPPPAPDTELWNRRVAYRPEHEHLALDRHAIVSVADGKGKIIYVNDLFCEISGYARNELLGRTHNIVKSGYHGKGFYRDMWQTIAGGQTWKGEICNRRKNGGLYWVESTIVPFLDKGGNPYQYVSIRTDITDLVIAEERLRRG